MLTRINPWQVNVPPPRPHGLVEHMAAVSGSGAGRGHLILLILLNSFMVTILVLLYSNNRVIDINQFQ